MSYAALTTPASPYGALQRPEKPQSGQSVVLKIDKFHALLCAEALKLGEFTEIIDSYKRFQGGESDTLWYFTQISQLDGAVKRPDLPALADAKAAWTESWKSLRGVARQAICDLGQQDPQSVDFGNDEVRRRLLAGLGKWPGKLYATGQGATAALTGWTCSVFVGEALCQTARRLKLPNQLFLQEQVQKTGKVLKFVGAENIVKSGLFEKVAPKEIKPGYIASLGGGEHVEIVTQKESDGTHFCSIGAGRSDVAALGKELCGSEDSFLGLSTSDRRKLDNSGSTFLRLKPGHSTTVQILKKIAA